MEAFNLVARLVLDSNEYNNKLRDAKDDASELSSKWSGIGKVVKAGVALIGTASAAVGMVAKRSVDAYANYEQLAGGVKKLYNTAADEVMKYANEAYRTSGMSANQYMEQATSFSAALVNSLNGDYKKAADQTDVAMRAISDNFNTFGGDITNVQNAFQGFAKQNYTMLDNLKLGYGGTKTEMERLIKDANEYAEANGMAADLSIDSFSDIVTAIDLIQQKQGIAGTTAKEAATTIEGSLNMTKAAWENLVAGLANPDADLGQLMDGLVTSIVGENEGEGLLNQIIPAVERAVDGIGQVIDKAAPILSKHFPVLMGKILPPLISAASTLIVGLVSALPQLIEVLADQAPMIITTLVMALTDTMPQLIDAAPMIIRALVDGISIALPELIPAVVEMVTKIVVALANNAPLIVEAGITLLEALIKGIFIAVPILVKNIPKIIVSIVRALAKGAGMLINEGASLITRFNTAFISGLVSLVGKVMSHARKIPSAIVRGVGSLANIGRNIIEGLWGGINNKFNSVVERVKGLASKLPNAVKKVLGIASPSKVFMELGKWIPEGLALGIQRNLNSVESASDAMADATVFTPYANRVDGVGRTLQIINNITVDGAENPEDFTDRFVRRLRMDMRTV